MVEYENLLACFRSGQMTEAQFQDQMRADAAFAAWVHDTLDNKPVS